MSLIKYCSEVLYRAMAFYFLNARFLTRELCQKKEGEKFFSRNFLVYILELSCWQCELRDVEAGVVNYVRFPLRGDTGLAAT